MPSTPPSSGHHHALGEELPHHAATARAERRADGNLPLTRHDARQQQIRHVRTRDEQQTADGGQCEKQRRPHAGRQIRHDRSDVNLYGPALAPEDLRGWRTSLRPRNSSGLRRSLHRRGVLRKARDDGRADHTERLGPRPWNRLHGPQTHVLIGKGEVKWGNADDDVSNIVDDEGSPKDSGVGAETLPPQSRAQDEPPESHRPGHRCR